MENKNNLLQQFEDLAPIEPREEWKEQLLQNLGQSSITSHRIPTYAWMMVALIVLLSINILSFSKGFTSQNSDKNVSNYKTVANEFFITSSSSKY